MSRKSIAKNSFYNLLYKGFTALFPLLTTSYISRVLLPDGVGIVAYANTIVNYFVVVAALGIPNYGVKVIASKRQNIEGRSKSFAELLTINAISTLIFLLLYYCLVNFSSIFHGKIVLMNTMGIMLVLNFFNIDWFYQGLEEYGYISTRSIIVKIISFVLMYIFVKTKEDYIIYAFILCLATAGNYFFNIFNARKYIYFSGMNELNIKKHIKPIMIIFGTSLATSIYLNLDTVMLGALKGSFAVGLYTASVKVVQAVKSLINSISNVIFPRQSNYLGTKKIKEYKILFYNGLRGIIVVTLPSAIGLCMLSKEIIYLFSGIEYIQAWKSSMILAINIIFSVIVISLISLSVSYIKRIFS